MDVRYTEEIEDRLGSVDCPVQVLWGRQDAWLPYRRGEELVERLPDARLHLVPSAGHLVQEDAPEAVVAYVLDFLAG
jgi:pimeloyl-ACP methyl ester carboxylesterase